MKSMGMLARKIRIKHIIKRGSCGHESGIIEPMEETAKYSQPISLSLQPFFVSSSMEHSVMTTHTQKYGCLEDYHWIVVVISVTQKMLKVNIEVVFNPLWQLKIFWV